MKSAAVFLSVVIPAYNESENIPPLVGELENVIRQCAEIKDHEIIIVDDHSLDNTFGKIQELNERNKRVTGIRLSRRSGSHTALRAGIASSRGDITLCLSADGQDDPLVLGEMLNRIHAGNHIVWALRRQREESFLSSLLARIAYRLIASLVSSELSHVDFSRADFFMFSRKFTEAIKACRERNTSLFGLIIWLGFKQDIVTYERRPRRTGDSKWRFGSKWRLLLDWVIAFSGVPLKMMSFIGLATATLGFLYACFIVSYSIFIGYQIPGWAGTVVLILLLGGTQMLMLGLAGEYLWRNLEETRARPLYFVEATTGEH